MITFEEALELKPREVLVDSQGKRWYVNGQVKTWKLNPFRIRVPIKHGLYVYASITEADFDLQLHGHVCPYYTKESASVHSGT